MGSLQITTRDGRRLDVELAGPAHGDVVLFHTGTPGAGEVYKDLIELGSARGLRHVCYSRPGYGDSDRRAGRSVGDCVEDVEDLAEALGVERFYTVGWSGGGPHALACAALLPARTIAAGTLAAVAPHDADGLDWLAGMGEENIEEFAAARAGEEQLREYLDTESKGILASSGEDIQAALGDLLSDVDRRILTGEFAEYMSTAAKHGLARGVDGWLDDDLAFAASWGFDLGAVQRPVTIWQGSEDRFVPYSHGQWLAANVAGAQARLIEGEGHLSITVGQYGQVLDELIAAG